jgi:hypothetical protein
MLASKNKFHSGAAKRARRCRLTIELRARDMPVLIPHSHNDQIVPIADSGVFGEARGKHPLTRTASGSL